MASAYTLVQALQAAGKHLTRQGIVTAVEQHGAKWTGPGLVPFRYTTTQHGGYAGVRWASFTAARSSSTASP